MSLPRAFGYDGIGEKHPCSSLPGLIHYAPDAPGKLQGCTPVPNHQGYVRGPSTYLHAGASKGWPHDPKAEDTFDLPPITKRDAYDDAILKEAHRRVDGIPHVIIDTRANPATKIISTTDDTYYLALSDGRLVLSTTHHKQIANFASYEEAQLAAEALNNHKGY